jgi:phage gpG-like protein
MLQNIHQLQKAAYVKVGVLSSAKPHEDDEGGPIDMVKLAAIHEFGVTNAGAKHNIVIKERPFIRGAADEYRQQIMALEEKELEKVMLGKRDVHASLEAMGLWMQAKIIARIRRGIAPPNAPATIARKHRKARWNKGRSGGRIVPLIDTGQLVQSISYEVVIK